MRNKRQNKYMKHILHLAASEQRKQEIDGIVPSVK
jgi:hypothetical protein